MLDGIQLSGEWHGGKGSAPRPTDKQKYDDNYDRIFRKKQDEQEKRDETESE